MKKNKYLIIISILIFLWVPSIVWGDKVILNEGKTLHGRIIEEDATSVTLRLGTNMVLRVQKSKINRIVRSKKKNKYSGPTVTLEEVIKEDKALEKEKLKEQNSAPPEKKKEAKKGSPAKSLPPGKPKGEKTSVSDLAAKSDSDKKPLLYNIPKEAKHRKMTKSNISIFELIEFQAYGVEGKSFNEVKKNIFDRKNGQGILEGRFRNASKTEMEVEWAGTPGYEGGHAFWKTLVIRSTITVSFPSWEASRKVKTEQIKLWNNFIKSVEEHDEGHVDIYHRNLKTLGGILSQLKDSSEKDLMKKSEKEFKILQKRVIHQQKGHDRRRPVKLPLETP